MREKRIILVPFEARFATARRLEVELGVVQLDIPPNQVLHHVQDFGIQHQVMERLVPRDGVEDATDGKATVFGTGDRELVVGRRQAIGIAEYLGECAAQRGQLARIEQLRKNQVAVLFVSRALFGRREHVGGSTVNRRHLRCHEHEATSPSKPGRGGLPWRFQSCLPLTTKS